MPVDAMTHREINALVSGLLTPDELAAQYEKPERAYDLADMLIIGNLESYAFENRAEGADPLMPEHHFREVPLPAVEFLKLIAYYTFNSCRYPEWAGSEAETVLADAFTATLKAIDPELALAYADAEDPALLASIPGYTDAPWGLGF